MCSKDITSLSPPELENRRNQRTFLLLTVKILSLRTSSIDRNKLQLKVLPASYNLQQFKSRVKRFLPGRAIGCAGFSSSVLQSGALSANGNIIKIYWKLN